MPKTTKRQASAWYSSSDDDTDGSLPYSRGPRAVPRQRHYGEQRTDKNKSGRNKSSSSLPRKSSSRFSKSALAAARSSSTKPKSNKKKIVIETNWNDDDSSSDEEQVSQARKTSKSTKRRAAPQSLPAFTPIVSKKKKRARKSSSTATPQQSRAPIRVNLTPDPPTDMPKVWLTKSRLLDVSKRNNGLAIQYRVMYHTSQNSIKDHNAGATRKIRYRDMVVQSRYACVSGSHGGSTYSFMRWKLPGTLLQSRNAKHITIYQDTRPQLPSKKANRKETDYPLIILCNELKGSDRRMAERFLSNAEAGMTPEQFYSKQAAASSKEADAMQQDDQDSPLVSQDEEDGDLGGYMSERENESPPLADKEKSRRDKRQGKPKAARVLADQNAKSSASRKRGHDGDDEAGKTAKRAKKRDYGGARNRHKSTKVTFQIGERDPGSSTRSQCMALVEGVVGSQSGSKRRPEEKAEDFIRDVFMNGRVDKLPSSGRMIELPSEAKGGTWSGELVDTSEGGRSGHPKGIMRDKLGNLKDARILFRHESTASMGPLQLSPSSPIASPASYSPSPRGLESRIRGGGSSSSSKKKRGRGHGTVTVSMIEASHARKHDLLAQGIVCKETLDGSTVAVGTISLVGFEGFTSATDSRISAAEKSASFLESCRKNAIAMEANEANRNAECLEDLLAIPTPDEDNGMNGHNVGASFICNIGLGESYGLFVAQDEDGHIVAVDVVFDASLFDNNSSLSSTSSTSPHKERSTRTPRLSEGLLQQHSSDMELVELRDRGDASSEQTDEDDSVGMILDDDLETPSLPGSPPSAAADGGREDSMSSEETIDDHERVKEKDAVVTIVPTPSTNRHVPTVTTGATAAAPKSILKKSTLFREVTPHPAPLLAQKAKQQSEASSSDEYTDEPRTTDVPFVTPAQGRGRQNREKSVGFLDKLDKVADTAEQNGREDDDSDDDVFEDPVNENVEEMFGLWGDHCEGGSTLLKATTTMVEDTQHLSAVESSATNPLQTTRSDVDNADMVLPHSSKSVPRRRLPSTAPFSAARILLVVLVLWQASLVPNDDDGLFRRAIPRRSLVVAATPFANAVKSGDKASLLPEQEDGASQSWLLSKLW